MKLPEEYKVLAKRMNRETLSKRISKAVSQIKTVSIPISRSGTIMPSNWKKSWTRISRSSQIQSEFDENKGIPKCNNESTRKFSNAQIKRSVKIKTSSKQKWILANFGFTIWNNYLVKTREITDPDFESLEHFTRSEIEFEQPNNKIWSMKYWIARISSILSTNVSKVLKYHGKTSRVEILPLFALQVVFCR